MDNPIPLSRWIISAILLGIAAVACQARFANLPTAIALRDAAPQPYAPPLASSPIVSQRAVPLDGTRPDRQVLIRSLSVSPDSANVAYRLRYGNGLMRDGYLFHAQNPTETKRPTDPTYAPDSQSVAVVLFDYGWKLHHRRDWLDGYEPVTPVRFSPDGQRLIYLARMESQRFVVEGDQPQPMAESIAWDQLVFTSDSAILAYPAFDGQHWRMVINGDPGPGWDRFVTAPVTAKQGPRVLYVATKFGRYHLVDRHTPGSIPDPIQPSGFRLMDLPPVVSADGKTFVYWAMSDDRVWRVYQNHQPVPGYDADRPGQLILSADGKTLAGILKRDGQWHVVQNGKPSKAYPAIGKDSLTFNADASRLAYAVKTPHGWAVVADGVEQQAYTQLAATSLRYSPDGKHFAYAAINRGKWSVIRDNQLQQPFNQINADSLTFSPDSQHLAYLAHQVGRATVIFDGDVVGQYDHAQQLTFSPDSNHLVWLAQQAGQFFLVVDGTPSTELFDQPIAGANIHFTADTTCQTVAIRRPGPTFARIELKLSPIPEPETDPSIDLDGTPDPADTPVLPEPLSPFVDVPTE